MTDRIDTRCENCGITQRAVLGTTNTHCVPPFDVQRHAFTGRHPADLHEDDFKKRPPIDTSKLGAIKINVSARETQARIVREALEAVAAMDETDPMVRRSLQIVARAADIDTLNRVARLLK